MQYESQGERPPVVPLRSAFADAQSSDHCTTPRYIPCRARYALASTAVLVEFSEDEDE